MKQRKKKIRPDAGALPFSGKGAPGMGAPSAAEKAATGGTGDPAPGKGTPGGPSSPEKAAPGTSPSHGKGAPSAGKEDAPAPENGRARPKKNGRGGVAPDPENYRLEGGVWREKAIFRESGCVVLLFEAAFPADAGDGPGGARIADFYRRMAAACDTYVRTILAARAADAFRADENPRKRFAFAPWRLSVLCTVTQADGVWFSVRRRVTFSRAARPPACREEGEVFSAATGAILPLAALPRAARPVRERGKPHGKMFYLDRDRIIFCPPVP